MNSLFKAIYNRFATTTGSGLYNDLSGQLYLNVADQEASFPYCVYFSVSDIDELDFTDEQEDFEIQFNIFTKDNSAHEAGEFLESLKTMYDNVSLTVTGWNHLRFKRDRVTPNNDFDQVAPVQGYSISYDVLLEKQRTDC